MHYYYYYYYYYYYWSGNPASIAHTFTSGKNIVI